MSFEMEHDEHQIKMTQDRIYGLEILGIECPHKSKISAIKAEIITYHRRDNKESTAWFTIELIEKVLDGSYCTTNNGEENNEKE